MKTVAPITLQQQQQVIAETNNYIQQASGLFGKKLPVIPVHFDLIGRTAGMYKVMRKRAGSERIIRYNPYLFAKYWTDNFSVTIPHEVAHYVVDKHYGLANVKPHGQEWKSVMSAFEADDSRTANFSLDGIPQRSMQRFNYRCKCRQHQLTTRRHNRIRLYNAVYQCRNCKAPLVASDHQVRVRE